MTKVLARYHEIALKGGNRGFFVDRLKDSIRRRGENISSVEVEAEVFAFPGVAEVAAVGVPSADGDQDVLVAVAATPGSPPIDAAELVRFLIPRMPHYMVPRYVRVMASLPKTPTNKIRKVEIRASRPTAWTASPVASRCAGPSSSEAAPRARRYFCTFWFISK